MNWYLQVLRKYAVFEGRARRTEYWMFVLFNVLISVALGVLDGLVGSGGILGGLYSLGVLLPSIAVGARRLHDTNRTGWWLLIAFIPIVGFLVLLYFFVLEGDAGSNEYGTDPKDEPVPAAA